MWADHAVGAQQGSTHNLDADHGELTTDEAKASISGRAKAEQGRCPMVDRQDMFDVEIAHRVQRNLQF